MVHEPVISRAFFSIGPNDCGRFSEAAVTSRFFPACSELGVIRAPAGLEAGSGRSSWLEVFYSGGTSWVDE